MSTSMAGESKYVGRWRPVQATGHAAVPFLTVYHGPLDVDRGHPGRSVTYEGSIRLLRWSTR